MTEFNKNFGSLGIDVSHHFGAGVYAKEAVIPAGLILSQHKHSFDHLSILASGTAKVTCEKEERTYTGPCCLTIPANMHHKVESVTDVVWFCIHATDYTDPQKIDHELVNDAN